MFKKIFGLAVILVLTVAPSLTMAETQPEDSLAEGDELLEISIGEANSSSGINCFDYYHFNSVEIELGLKQGVLIPGRAMVVDALLRNHNDYPLVDGGLLIQVFRTKTNGSTDVGNYLIDEFWAAQSLTLNALGEKRIGFDWQAPAGLSGGSYLMVGHFLIADKMNLSGLSFTEGIYGGLSEFTFEEFEVNEAYFDKENIKVDDQSFQARGFIPVIEKDQVKLSFNLKSLAAKDRTINVSEKLYRWDNLSPEQLVLSQEKEIALKAGELLPLTRELSDLKPGVYLFEARTDQSILKIRFVVDGSDAPARFNFIALNSFPIKGNEDNSFFVCFHSTNDIYGNEGRIEVILEDEIGNEIETWDYEGEITPGIMAGLAEFTTRRDYNQVWLKGRLYQDDQLIDQVDLFYDVNLFTDMADLSVRVEDGQLVIHPYDMAGRLTDTRLTVEVRDKDEQLVYFNPSYYGSDLRGDVNFIAGQSYKIRILSGGNWYDVEYIHRTGSTLGLWLLGVIILIFIMWLLFKRRGNMSKKSQVASMAFVLGIGLLIPLMTQAGSQQSYIDRIFSQLGSWAETMRLSTTPRFQAGPVRSGTVTVSTGAASQKNIGVLDSRTAICNNRRSKGPNNPCHAIYDSTFRSGIRVFASHIGLSAKINFTNNYPVYLVNVETGDRIVGGDIINLGDILRIELGEPTGEWYFTGGAWDTPPISWVANAQNDYNQLKPIDGNYLTSYQMNARSLGVIADNIFTPQIGAAATNPLTMDQIQVSTTESLRAYREGSSYYIEAIAPGIGEVQVQIPESFIYATIDNLWFEQGRFPQATQVTAIGVVPEVETLSVSLSADPASGTAPLTVDLTASISPDSTATGLASFTFWCDCSYTGASIEGAISQCGAWVHRATDQNVDSYTADNVCTYGVSGSYTPKVIVERGLAEAAQAQVADLRVSDAETIPPRAENLDMDPDNCTNDCRSCDYPLNPTLYWKFVSDEGNNQSGFEIHFATNSGFNNYINVTNGWINSSSEAYAVPIDYLDYGYQYWWRIRVKDDQGMASAWSIYSGTYTTLANPYPEPDFSWEPEPPVLEEETQFTDNSKVYGGGTNSWLWTFPEAKIAGGAVQDPLTSTSRNPSIIFTGTSSQRSVKLIVTDSAGLYCDLTKAVPTTGIFGLPDYEEVAP